MKKILAIFLMTALLVCPAFASAEADVEVEEDTATTQSDTVTISDDMIADIAAAVAALQEEEAEPACNHALTVEVTVAPTCTEKGLLTYTCSECGLTFTVETLPTGEHDYVASTKDATCTEDGEITYTCSMCGDTYTEVIPATGHTPSAEAATCIDDVVCTVCGEVLEPATGHAYTYQYDAVLDEEGNYVSYGTWVCDNCGDVIDATEGNAVYYYGLLEEAEASGEASGEIVELADPNTGLWTTIEIIAVIVFIVEGAILMASFGKKKKTAE